MVTRRALIASAPLLALAAACSPVTLARRLLMAAGGGGSFPAPPVLSAFALTAAPQGGWCWFQDPRALHHGTKTYVGYSKGTSGDLAAVTVDDGTLAVSAEAVVYPAFEIDDHASPAFVAMASGYIGMGFTVHVGDIYWAVGSTPGALPSGLGDVVNITASVGARSGSAGYTYAHLAELAGTVHYLHRWHDAGGTAHVSRTQSSDGGATWSARADVCTVTYHKMAPNGSDRIDLILSPHPTSDPGPHSVYHMYWVPSTDKWYTSAGAEITASRPFAVTEATLVYDGTTTAAWVWDVAIEPGTGHPVAVYATFPSTSDHRYNWARWDGSAWTSHQMAAAGGYIPTAIVPGAGSIEDHYSGGVVLDHADPSVAYASVNVGAGRWDVYRCQTADHGATWSSYALTSSGKNVRPIPVVGHGSSPQVLWLTGTYDDYVSYSQGISGAGS